MAESGDGNGGGDGNGDDQQATSAGAGLVIDTDMHDADQQKRAAAYAALELVQDGMRLGLGTGSTADWFVRGLGERVTAGLRVTAVATSERTTRLAAAVGVAISEPDGALDLAIDGADMVAIGSLAAVKGQGGALTREKIIAAAATTFVIICDESKVVSALSDRPTLVLPVEVLPFGVSWTTRLLAAFGHPTLRLVPGTQQPMVTDNGNVILDLEAVGYADPEALSASLHATVGVVEHGLFIGLAQRAYIGTPTGVQTLLRNS